MTTVAEQFQVVADQRHGHIGTEGEAVVRAVEAEAGTGYRYVVVATRLPAVFADREGGTHLVTIVQPFQAAYVMQGHGPVYPAYIEEKFAPDSLKFANPENRDALTLTIAHVLGREAVL